MKHLHRIYLKTFLKNFPYPKICVYFGQLAAYGVYSPPKLGGVGGGLQYTQKKIYDHCLIPVTNHWIALHASISSVYALKHSQ